MTEEPQRQQYMPPVPYLAAKRAFEREYLSELLRQTKGNVLAAAKISKCNRTQLYKRIDRLGLSDLLRSLRPTRHGNGGNAAWRELAS